MLAITKAIMEADMSHTTTTGQLAEAIRLVPTETSSIATTATGIIPTTSTARRRIASVEKEGEEEEEAHLSVDGILADIRGQTMAGTVATTGLSRVVVGHAISSATFDDHLVAHPIQTATGQASLMMVVAITTQAATADSESATIASGACPRPTAMNISSRHEYIIISSRRPTTVHPTTPPTTAMQSPHHEATITLDANFIKHHSLLLHVHHFLAPHHQARSDDALFKCFRICQFPPRVCFFSV
jgi:hypothetical protein